LQAVSSARLAIEPPGLGRALRAWIVYRLDQALGLPPLVQVLLLGLLCVGVFAWIELEIHPGDAEIRDGRSRRDRRAARRGRLGRDRRRRPDRDREQAHLRRDVIARQWANAKRKIGVDVVADLRVLNGEIAIIVRLASALDVVVAVVHLETRAGAVVALRVNRDPRSTAALRSIERCA
jgi:hypothetical protein